MYFKEFKINYTRKCHDAKFIPNLSLGRFCGQKCTAKPYETKNHIKWI